MFKLNKRIKKRNEEASINPEPHRIVTLDMDSIEDPQDFIKRWKNFGILPHNTAPMDFTFRCEFCKENVTVSNLQHHNFAHVCEECKMFIGNLRKAQARLQ